MIDCSPVCCATERASSTRAEASSKFSASASISAIKPSNIGSADLRACSARAELGRIPRAFWIADSIGIDSLLGEGTMPTAYSADIRGRVIARVESGASRREAAEQFEVSAEFGDQMGAAYRTTGRCAAKPRGGSTSPLEEHADFLLALIEEQPDLTLDEVVCAMRKRKIPGSRTAVWRFFQRHKITFKKKPARGGAGARRRGAGAAALDARTGHV